MKKKSLLIGLILIVLSLSGARTAMAVDRALLIGVGNYQIPKANLNGIDKDLGYIQEVARLMGFEPAQIKVLKDSGASTAEITKAMKEWLISGVTPNDRVLFYFSGHGSFVKDLDGDEDDGRDEVLLPHDFGLENQQLVRFFLDDDFSRLLKQIPAKSTFIFIDACHSGTAIRGLKALTRTSGEADIIVSGKSVSYIGMPEPTPKSKSFVKQTQMSFTKRGLNDTDNFVSLAAARDDEEAVATNMGSLFTLALADTFRKAATEGRPLTMAELETSVSTFIKDQADKIKSKVHHPMLEGNKSLANQNLIKPGVTPPPTAAAPSPTPPSPTTAPPPTATPTPTQGQKDLWNEMLTLADSAAFRVEISAEKSTLKVGEYLKLTCQIPRTGYLNILNLDPTDENPTVLFPNQFHPDNQVQANTTIDIPAKGDRFSLRVKPPRRQNLIVAILTEHEVNAFREGYGGEKSILRSLSLKSITSIRALTRVDANASQPAAITVVPPATQPPAPTPPPTPPPSAYGAGKVIVNVE